MGGISCKELRYKLVDCITRIRKHATEDESKITTVRAIFFTANANEDAATVTADLTLDNDEAGLDANGIPSGAAGKAFKVPATSKRILIIANPSPKFEAKTASETDQKMACWNDLCNSKCSS